MCVCVAVKVPVGDSFDVQYINGQDEFAALVGGADVFRWNGNYIAPKYEPGACLCPIDVRATLEVGGFDVREGWDEYGADYVAQRRTHTPPDTVEFEEVT